MWRIGAPRLARGARSWRARAATDRRRTQRRWPAFPLPRLVVAQAAIGAMAAAFGALGGRDAALSALAGAVVCGVANVYAAWRVFVSASRPVSQHGELANLYRAEFGKLVIIGALSAVLFALSPVVIVAFIGGCAGALLGGTLVAVTFKSDTSGTRHSKLQDDHGE